MATIGQSLREEREARGISLEEVASATKIVLRYLEALEDDRLDIMPGGFFIKGIIRNYAKAIALDPDEVLGRYYAAGLVGGPPQARPAPPKPASGPEPRLAPALDLGPIPDANPAVPSEPPVSAAPQAATPILFEEPAEPEPSPESRKRILAWAWRALAALAIIAAAYFLFWPALRSRRPRPEPSSVVTQTVLPPPQTTSPGTAPASLAQSDPASAEPVAKPEAPPAAEIAWEGVTMEITFQSETWIQVRTDGVLKVDGLFPAGATARAQADKELLIHTGNAGAFTFNLNGRPAKPLGRVGQVLTDIKITPENYRDFLEGPSSGPPAA